MRLLGRLLGAVLLLLCTVGIVACAVGIVEIWRVRQTVSQKVESVSGRLETGLNRVAEANRDFQRALEKARADVAQVNKESAGLGTGAEKDRLTSALVRKLIQQQLGPHVNDLGGRLAVFADASTALASLLQSLQELPLGESEHLDPDKLERTSAQATDLASTLQHLQGVVGEGDRPMTEREVADAANEVDRVLQQCQTTVADWQTDLDAARQEVARVQERILHWLTIGAIVVTVVLAWVEVCQFSLFAHAWKWCWGA